MSMDTPVARAFLNMQLSPDQRDSLRAYERSGTLPKGRYLSASEICLKFSLKPAPVPEVDLRAMKDLLFFYITKVQWKQRKFEDKQHEIRCKTECLCSDAAAEMHEWEDYALKNFGNSAAA